MRVASALKWHELDQDPGGRARERAESARIIARAKSESIRARRVAAKVDRITSLYRERLIGTRPHE